MRRLVFAVPLILGILGCRDRSPHGNATGESAARAEAPGAVAADGEALYMQHCSVCHMPDGGGVPNFQPSLSDSPIVTGDPTRLEIVLRAGSAALRDRPNEFGTEMPPFGFLSDAEAKAIVAYLRRQFAGERSR